MARRSCQTLDPMQTYSERSAREPSFEVSYRFLSEAEGGRKSAPHQYTRWDFAYEADGPLVHQAFMIWPEFIAPSGKVLPEGEIPLSGRALMFILDDELWPFHRERISIGVRGFFVEGAKKVAECTVTEVLGLSHRHEV